MYTNPELRKKTWPWYHPSFGQKLSPEGRNLLQQCGVRPEDVDSHIYRVREEAWEIFPFPCIGDFWFLEFGITHHPRFQDIVTLLQLPVEPEQTNSTAENGDPVVNSIVKLPSARRLLDLGTCVGQDLRALRAAGAPAETLFGTDLFAGFKAVGHSMFRDEDTFGNNFFAADILDDSPANPLKITAGCWDVVTVTMFFHQFDEKTGLEIASRMIPLLKNSPGSMIVGNNTGETVAREIPLAPPFTDDARSKSVMRHSRESMRTLWERAIDRNEANADSARESRWGIGVIMMQRLNVEMTLGTGSSLAASRDVSCSACVSYNAEILGAENDGVHTKWCWCCKHLLAT